MKPVAAPVPPEQWRSVDMSQSNAWTQWAADWLENQKPAKTFEKAAKELKALVEPDVGHAYSNLVEAKRSKNGAIRISEVK
jgi:hypothetical protein